MKELILSNCEKDFLLKAIAERKRLDGRGVYEYRKTKISFGIGRGSCTVELGNTRVMANVSCEVTNPKDSRPTEGILYVNVELSPMAAPHFEAGRQSDLAVEINRIMERTLRESRCLDTESLCITAGLKVWTVRVDVHVLNHDGNIIDASGIAAIGAMIHFRRPDVTICGDEVTIHSLEDKDPIPLSIHHMPICVTFAFFPHGMTLVDPSNKEEQVMDGKMVIAMNKHREMCMMQMSGKMYLLSETVKHYTDIAVKKATDMTQLLQQALLNDAQERTAGRKCGFAVSEEYTQSMPLPQSAGSTSTSPIDVSEAKQRAEEVVLGENIDSDDSVQKGKRGVSVLEPGLSRFGEGNVNTWDSDTEMELQAEQKLASGTSNDVEMTDQNSTELIEDSEEEEVILIGSSNGHGGARLKNTVVPKVDKVPASATIDLTVAVVKKKKSGKKKKVPTATLR